MEGFVIIVLIECAAAFLTSIGCRLASRRHRQAGWYIALLAAVGVAVLFMFLDNGSLLFQPSQWSHHKCSLESLLIGFVSMIVIGLIPALFVVQHYREKFKKGARNVV